MLKQVATETIERKRRLGQYAVVWRDNQPVIIGSDELNEVQLKLKNP